MGNMEVSYEQITGAVSYVVVTLVGAVGALTAWILSQINDLKAKHTGCEAGQVVLRTELQEVKVHAAKLETKIEEMEKLNPDNLALQVAAAVAKALEKPKG